MGCAGRSATRCYSTPTSVHRRSAGTRQPMQLSQLTIAVLAESGSPRQWSLLPPHRPLVYRPVLLGLGMVAGVMAVTFARGWLHWRRPKPTAQVGRQAAIAGLSRSPVPQPASAPVSVALSPATAEAVVAGQSTTGSAFIWPPRAGPVRPTGRGFDHTEYCRRARLRVGLLGQLTVSGHPGAQWLS